jgi:DNA modification methylase
MAKAHRSAIPSSSSSLDPLIERVSQFSADHYWDLGKFLVERVIPAALKEGVFAEQILKRMAEMPGFKFPYSMLKQCQRYYSYYPDVEKRPLPEGFYFELATKVDESKKRDHYEKMAIANKWTISDLQRKIRDDELARRADEKTRFGFDLKQKNIWSFDIPDPRFGKPNMKGRLPGQIVANALFYYTGPGWVIVDPMAGSGTTGDVIDSLPYFNDRTYRMYDIEPSDARIKRANILQTGIPEQTGSVDYVFLDPPHDFYPRGTEPEFTPGTVLSETLTKFKTILRECARILKAGGRMSVIVEPTVGPFGIIDFPFEVTRLVHDLGLASHSKAYLPRRTETGRAFVSVESMKNPLSDCRELLTFEKQ